MSSQATIEIWVPGPWRDGEALNVAGSRRDDVRMLPRDPELAGWMDVGSGGAFSNSQLKAIDQHAGIACLSLKDTGKRIGSDLLAATAPLKKAGGLGVRVARCGLAHPWDRWEAFLKGR